MSYKRNQIEEAIDSSELGTRIKRLLELDRSLGRKLRSKDAEQANFAFFSEEQPGTGADISFSEYEAFALLNGLKIMGHGWPRGFAVEAAGIEFSNGDQSVRLTKAAAARPGEPAASKADG